jgi:Zn-dependent protease
VSADWTTSPPPRRRPGAVNRTTVVLVVIAAVVVLVLLHTHHLSTFTLVYFCALIPSIILHEISHGAVAYALGDDTAKRAGRLTLNPLPHIDPLGSVVVPALLVLSGSGVAFGWAKPVPVNVSRLRHPRNGSVIVSLAGPLTNGVLFVGCALAFRYLLAHGVFLTPTTTSLPLGYQFLLAGGLANITVGVFNLVPLPPLDGSALVERLVPDRHLAGYYRIRPYGMVIVFLFAIFFLQSSAIGGHLLSAELRAWNAVSGFNIS